MPASPVPGYGNLSLAQVSPLPMDYFPRHRLSTVLNSNKIYVIDSGKIIDYGKHEDLLINSKIYKNFHDKQFQR